MLEPIHSKIMKQLSMQNLPNDFDSTEKTLVETVKQVEVSDRISSQSKSLGTYSVKTPSLRPSQNETNTKINAKPLSAQISKQTTVVQVASPLSPPEAGNGKTILQNPNPQDSTLFSKQTTVVQVASPLSPPEAGNGKTILQNPNPKDSTPSEVLVDDVSLPQKPKVVKQIGSLSQPTQTVEAIDRTQNPIARFSSEDDSKNLNAAEVGVVQNFTERTFVQYSDSVIHNSAQQTFCQAMSPSSTNLGRTFIQSEKPKSSHSSTLTTVPKNRAHIQPFHLNIRGVFRRTLSSFWRKVHPRQLQSLFRIGKRPAMDKILERPSSTPFNYSTHNAIASGEQPNLEQYQKKQRELDLCRLCFAKELARNGKFRSAIAEAEQISETSYYFKDAQMLILSWK